MDTDKKFVKILKVSLKLDGSGWKKDQLLFLMEEKNKQFTNNIAVFDKNRFMKPFTVFRDSCKCYHYYAICREDNKNDAFEMLHDYIYEKVFKTKKEIDNLILKMQEK